MFWLFVAFHQQVLNRSAVQPLGLQAKIKTDLIVLQLQKQKMSSVSVTSATPSLLSSSSTGPLKTLDRSSRTKPSLIISMAAGRVIPPREQLIQTAGFPLSWREMMGLIIFRVNSSHPASPTVWLDLLLLYQDTNLLFDVDFLFEKL